MWVWQASCVDTRIYNRDSCFIFRAELVDAETNQDAPCNAGDSWPLLFVTCTSTAIDLQRLQQSTKSYPSGRQQVIEVRRTQATHQIAFLQEAVLYIAVAATHLTNNLVCKTPPARRYSTRQCPGMAGFLAALRCRRRSNRRNANNPSASLVKYRSLSRVGPFGVRAAASTNTRNAAPCSP